MLSTKYEEMSENETETGRKTTGSEWAVGFPQMFRISKRCASMFRMDTPPWSFGFCDTQACANGVPRLLRSPKYHRNLGNPGPHQVREPVPPLRHVPSLSLRCWATHFFPERGTDWHCMSMCRRLRIGEELVADSARSLHVKSNQPISAVASLSLLTWTLP